MFLFGLKVYCYGRCTVSLWLQSILHCKMRLISEDLAIPSMGGSQSVRQVS